jgi:hypothetical protein
MMSLEDTMVLNAELYCVILKAGEEGV